MSNDNLPMKQEKQLVDLKTQKNITDILKKSGKVISSLGIAGGAILIGGTVAIVAPAVAPVVSTLALMGATISSAKALSNIVYKSEPSLTFVSKKSTDGTISIFQDALSLPSYLRGISIADKASIMGLQTLIGFQRFKADCKVNGTPTIQSNDKMVYEQKFSTVTHSVNLNNLKALADAGYIEILEEQEEVHRIEGIEKALRIKPRKMKSLLIMEQIGFANISGIKKTFSAFLSGDKEKLESMKKTMKKVTFRLTDKEINFEDIYKKINGYEPYENEEEKKNLKRLRTIFGNGNSRVPGVLSDRAMLQEDGAKCMDRKSKIDIHYDKFGRPVLEYDAKESFGEKIDREYGVKKIDRNLKKSREKTTLDDRLKEGIDFDRLAKAQRKIATEEKLVDDKQVNKDREE